MNDIRRRRRRSFDVAPALLARLEGSDETKTLARIRARGDELAGEVRELAAKLEEAKRDDHDREQIALLEGRKFPAAPKAPAVADKLAEAKRQQEAVEEAEATANADLLVAGRAVAGELADSLTAAAGDYEAAAEQALTDAAEQADRASVATSEAGWLRSLAESSGPKAVTTYVERHVQTPIKQALRVAQIELAEARRRHDEAVARHKREQEVLAEQDEKLGRLDDHDRRTEATRSAAPAA